MKQLFLGLLAATAISSDVLLRAVVSVNVSNASGSAASSSAAASGSNREEVGLGEPREPPVAPEEAECPASQSSSSLSAAPASDSKRRRLRGKQAPSKTDEKQVGKGEPLMESCPICYEEFPASDLERFFDACGAGDICAPGHKLCSTCACKLKEKPRANAKNAHCPLCNKTAEGERPNHRCEVCNNEGGPRNKRDGTTPQIGDVGCWGCGRQRDVVPPGPPARLPPPYDFLLAGDAASAFIVPVTTAQLDEISQRERGTRVLGAFANVIPTQLQTDPAVLLHVLIDFRVAMEVGVHPSIIFTLEDWNRLPEGLRASVPLTGLAVLARLFRTNADFETHIPEAVRQDPHVVDCARRVGLLDEEDTLLPLF